MARSNVLNLGDIDLPGDGYPNIFEYTIPVMDGLEGAYLLGPGGELGKNIAPGKADATVVGSPAHGSIGYAFNANDYLETGIAETAYMTLVVAIKDPSSVGDENAGFIGNFSSPTSGGIAIYGTTVSGKVEVTGNSIRNQASTGASVAGSDLSAPTLTAIRAYNDGVTPTRVDDLTRGLSNIGALANAPRTVDSTRGLRIGRIYVSGFSGLSEVGLAMIYSRALTDTELKAVETWARDYMAAQGVTV